MKFMIPLVLALAYSSGAEGKKNHYIVWYCSFYQKKKMRNITLPENRFRSNWRFNTASRLHEMKQKNDS